MATREVTAHKETTIPAPKVPKGQGRELSALTEHIVREISQMFRREVLESMSKGAVATFADAAPVNFGAEYARQVRVVQRRLSKRLGDAKIRGLIDKILRKADGNARRALYAQVEKAVGLSTKELTATEGLSAIIDSYIAETTQWVIKLRDDTLSEYTANTLRAMSLGQSLEDVMKQYKGLEEKRKNHAKFTARNQIANFNSLTTKVRAQNLGITEAIWRTARDETVRDSHKDRNGKRFDLGKGLYSALDGKWLLPGVDFQCRCDYELIIPGAG